MSDKNLITKAWHKTLKKQAARPALINASSGIVHTFSEVQAASTRWSKILKCAQGQCLAHALSNSLDWIAVFLAAQRLGIAVMPLDESTPIPALKSLARRLGATCFLRKRKILRLVSISNKRIAGTAYCKTSSGSTGLPSITCCSDLNLLADVEHVTKTMGIRTSDRNLGLIPFGHSYGVGNLVMPLITRGTTLVFASSWMPNQIPDWIQEHQITVFPAVPHLLDVLNKLRHNPETSRLRLVISAGAPLAPATAREFKLHWGVSVHNFYGTSETGGICYDRDGTASLTGRSVGKPLKGVKVQILRNSGIRVSSRAVATPDHRCEISDLAKRNHHGEIVFLRRIEKVANIGGKKAHPAEIAATLKGIKGVRNAWATVFSKNNRDYIAAAVETDLEKAVIEVQLAKRLAAWKIPRLLLILSELPHSSRGKLDTGKLLELLGLDQF